LYYGFGTRKPGQRIGKVAQHGCMHRPRRKKIIKIMVLLHSAVGVDWQSPPKGVSLKTLSEAEEQGFILIRGEFQKRQFRLTELGAEYVGRDKRRLEARKL
jgi:DNA-binding PadR family transcriptional regulator